jgi:phosphoglycerate dehydrogenase-like enzyme
MKKTVLIDVPLSDEVMDRLSRQPGLELRVADPITETPISRSTELLRDVSLLFCMLPPINIEDARSLEFIQISSAGYTQLVGLGLAERGVRAANALGVFDTAIAEWNVAMMVNLARDLRQMVRNQESGVWDRSAVFQREIRGATVGIWGYGGIGRETARLAKTLGQAVHVLELDGVKPRPRDKVYGVPGTGDPEGVLPDRVFTLDQRLEFLRGLDFLILSMPMNKSNRGIVGADELRALPPHAFLLNPARGPLVDEQALLTALREGWIAGAALDAHFAYPLPPEHQLWQMGNVIMTPHISGSSQSPHYVTRIWDLFVQNLDRLQQGETLLNELSPEQLRD